MEFIESTMLEKVSRNPVHSEKSFLKTRYAKESIDREDLEILRSKITDMLGKYGLDLRQDVFGDVDDWEGYFMQQYLDNLPHVYKDKKGREKVTEKRSYRRNPLSPEEISLFLKVFNREVSKTGRVKRRKPWRDDIDGKSILSPDGSSKRWKKNGKEFEVHKFYDTYKKTGIRGMEIQGARELGLWDVDMTFDKDGKSVGVGPDGKPLKKKKDDDDPKSKDSIWDDFLSIMPNRRY